jgi:hypothetical protein
MVTPHRNPGKSDRIYRIKSRINRIKTLKNLY